MPSPAIRKNSFLVVGRAGMDLYADPPSTRSEEASRFFACLGGSAGNIAAGLTRLGNTASLVSAVSDDAVGRFVLRQLSAFGVDVTHVRIVRGDARTSLAVTETCIEHTQNTIYRNGAADLEINIEQTSGINYGDYGGLIVTGTALAANPSREAVMGLIQRGRSAGLLTVLDIDYRAYSWQSAQEASAVYRAAADLCDVIVGNDDEFAVTALGREAGYALAREFATNAGKLVIYKMGERGSVTFLDGGSFETEIFAVKALKPMGAGDAFMAAVMASLAGGSCLHDAVQRGSAAAALVVSRIGCAPAMPTVEELDAFVKNSIQMKAMIHAHTAVS